ncbi:MAG: zinc-finger domain-containing protein [Alphaproteobacteria bacterium]|nr:zinc-finger domain-containing protein [Alphaproteobacteria bacterium]
MTQIPETILVDNDIDEVSCDGGGGALGHPKVWYTFDGQDSVECSYCDRLFVKKRAAKAHKAA